MLVKGATNRHDLILIELLPMLLPRYQWKIDTISLMLLHRVTHCKRLMMTTIGKQTLSSVIQITFSLTNLVRITRSGDSHHHINGKHHFSQHSFVVVCLGLLYLLVDAYLHIYIFRGYFTGTVTIVGLSQWAYYQIRKVRACACAGNAGNVFSAG